MCPYASLPVRAQVAKEHLTEENIPCCQCTICLYGFADGDVFTKTQCYHYFHSHCLARYVRHALEQIALEEADKLSPTLPSASVGADDDTANSKAWKRNNCYFLMTFIHAVFASPLGEHEVSIFIKQRSCFFHAHLLVKCKRLHHSWASAKGVKSCTW